MNKKTLLDANVIMRYLLDDNHEQNLTARETIENNECFTVLSVVQEVVYNLETLYDIPRKDIKTQFLTLSGIIEIEDDDVFMSAFQYYTETPKIDFVDCVICGYQQNRDVNVLTFDKKLQKKLARL